MTLSIPNPTVLHVQRRGWVSATSLGKWIYRLMESLMLEKFFKIIKFNRDPSSTWSSLTHVLQRHIPGVFEHFQGW